jgi:hypothetical protein
MRSLWLVVEFTRSAMAAVAPIERRVIDGKGMYAAKLARQPLRGCLMQLKEEGHRQLSIGAAVCAAASKPATTS